MKLLALAWRDLRRQFRSGLLLLMMIGVPLLLTGLLYFAFGSSSGGPSLQPTTLAVADLDRPPALAPVAVGEVVTAALRSPELEPLLRLAPAADLAQARDRVRKGELGALLIVPADATRALMAGGRVDLELVTDPGRPLAAGVVRDVVQAVADGLSSGAVAAHVAASLAADEALPDGPALGLMAAVQAAARPRGASPPAVTVAAPVAGGGDSFARRMAAEVMAAMMIFFVFFSGAYGASAVLREQEEGTLKRLNTTPTTVAMQLAGRFLGIAAILVTQIAVLLIAARLVFGIAWGRPLPVAVAGLALAVDAAGFGVLLLAFVRTSRQSGPVFGVVLTVTGMVGGLMTATMPSVPPAFQVASLFTPQGWAMALWRGCMAGDTLTALLPALTGTLVIGLGLLAVGVPLMHRRFVRGV